MWEVDLERDREGVQMLVFIQGFEVITTADRNKNDAISTLP
jgi:hypothetical protein